MVIDAPITLTDAKNLLDVLENDIPENEKSKVAFRLLILSANPELGQDETIITNKKKSSYSYSTHDYSWQNSEGFGPEDYYGY